MNVHIEKISNGFILTLDGKRIFCDVPEAVCGELAQWALAECESAKESTTDKVKSALELMYRQSQSHPLSVTRLGSLLSSLDTSTEHDTTDNN